MEVYRRSSGLLLLLGFALLATTLQGVQGEVESEGPSESECRPYIEKALKELEAGESVVGSSETVDGSKEDTSTVEVTDDSETQGGDGDDNDTNEDAQDSKESKESNQETVSETKAEPEVRQNLFQKLSNRISQFFQRTPVNETKAATIEEKSSEDKETDVSGEQDQPSEESDKKSNEVSDTKEEFQEEVADAALESGEAQADEASDDSKTGDDEHKESEEQVESKEEAQAESAEEAEAVSKEDEAESQEEAVEEQVEEETEAEADKNAEEEKKESREEQTENEDEQAESKEDEATQETVGSVEEEDAGPASVEEQEAQLQTAEEEQAESKEQEESKEIAAEEQEQTEDTEKPAESKEEPAESTEQQTEAYQDTTQEDDGDSQEAAAAISHEEQADASEEKQNSVEEAGNVIEEESKQELESVEEKQEPAEDGEKESADEDAVESQENKASKEDEESGEKKTIEKREAGDEPVDEGKEKADESEEDKKTDDDDTKSSETTAGDSKGAEEDAGPVEELSLDVELPTELRPRDHVEHLLKLDEESSETEQIINRVNEITLRELKKLYENAIKPLEVLYKYRDLSNRHFGDSEIFSKPLILFMGPWSGGKSSIINYLLNIEYNETSLRTGAEPSPAYFNLLMYGEEPEIIDGTELAADFTFSGLQKFGQGLEERLRGVKVPATLLEKVNIVEIPGILEVRKQVSRVFPFNDACQWFIDRADIIFLVYDPSKLDVGPETEAILDQLKGREQQTRIILNKADQVKPEELMRVQGALIWNISPLMSSPQPPVMYTTSLWSKPYEPWAPTKLLQAQERAFLRDLRGAIDKRIENKIASARRFAVRVRNHAKMVDCYLTTYYNHKSVFGNRKQVADEIIDHPQDYHIYEGLSTLTNISRYDLPDPDVYRDFFKLNPLYEFQQLSATCTYFRGCPINRLDIAIAYDLPELVGTHKKLVEKALEEAANQPSAPGS